MDPIWQNLPDDVALHVISFLDDIDTRRAFGFKPRKLKFDKDWEFRRELTYNPDTRVLFRYVFDGDGIWVDDKWVITHLDRYYLTFFTNISKDFSLEYNSMVSISRVEIPSLKVIYKQNKNISDTEYNSFIDTFRYDVVKTGGL